MCPEWLPQVHVSSVRKYADDDSGSLSIIAWASRMKVGHWLLLVGWSVDPHGVHLYVSVLLHMEVQCSCPQKPQVSIVSLQSLAMCPYFWHLLQTPGDFVSFWMQRWELWMNAGPVMSELAVPGVEQKILRLANFWSLAHLEGSLTQVALSIEFAGSEWSSLRPLRLAGEMSNITGTKRARTVKDLFSKETLHFSISPRMRSELERIQSAASSEFISISTRELPKIWTTLAAAFLGMAPLRSSGELSHVLIAALTSMAGEVSGESGLESLRWASWAKSSRI